MNTDTRTQLSRTSFDRELALLVAFFGLAWVLIGGGGYYAYPVFACLNFEPSDSTRVCERALERSVLPSAMKSKVRMKLVDAYSNASDNLKALAVIADEEKASGGSAMLFDKKAGLLRSEGRSEDAATAYREVVKLSPTNEAAAEALVTIEVDSGNIVGARQTAADFVKNNPNSTVMMSWQGWVEHRAGENELALTFFDRAMALAPNNAGLHRDVADIKLAMKKPLEAIDAMTKAIQFAPDNGYYLDKRAEIYESLGESALSQADYEKSIMVYRSVSTLVALGRSYTDSGHYEKALSLLNEAISQEEEIEWAHSSKIRLLVFQKKYPEAKLAIEELRQKIPESLDCKYWEAIIAGDESRYEDALKGFQSILKEWPNHSDSLLETGHALIELNRPAESISYFTQAIGNWPASDVAYAARARGNYYLGNWWATLSDANQSIKLKPKQGSVFGYRALALAKLARVEEAKASFEISVLNAPKIEWVQQDYFNFLLNSNDLTGAKLALDGLRTNIPDSKFISEFEAALTARGIKVP
jgi:tetratricopeptide (TPR) repeat protein